MNEILAVLGGSIGTASSPGSADVLRLALEALIRRYGAEMRLVVPPHLPGQIPAPPTPSLLKAVARARQWYEWVITGKVWGGRSIAQKAGFSERHVSQILECAFLRPGHCRNDPRWTAACRLNVEKIDPQRTDKLD